MTGLPSFDYERLRYIQLRGDGSKLPAKSWGGYSQDFDDAPHVHTHEDVDIHPSGDWGVVDVESDPHMSKALLIFDVDIHKAPDGFDPDRLTVPEDTLVTRSQNGGFHVYFVLSGYGRGELQESDFQMAANPGFDVDIRGSVVSHHVVAPADIPGVGGDYGVVNDHKIRSVFEPGAAAERITLDDDPLLEFNSADGIDSYDFDVPSEPPDEMPTCYHAGLELRKAAPDDHPNSHKVNVLTAACGLAAGYSPEEIAGHFCGEWGPKDGETDLSDKEMTEYQVRHIADGGYSPPAESTLRDYGILDDGHHCENCPIEYHGPLDDRDGGSTRQHQIGECEPPADRCETFDREAHWQVIQDRTDAWIDEGGIRIFADEAGSGKTTNVGRAAADLDEDHAMLFDKHEKAREYVTNDATPDGYLHLKGSEQKREDACMDADHAGDDVDCPEHGHSSTCPSMCPVYDRPKDEGFRQLFEDVVAEVGPVDAHLLLEPHDGDGCAFLDQFEDARHADRIVGVHEYLRLSTVTDDRAVIIDEKPRSLRSERALSIRALTKVADDLRKRAGPKDAAARTLVNVGDFTREVVEVMIGSEDAPDSIAELDPPRVMWDTYDTYNDVAGHHTEYVEPEEDWQLAEALAQAKIRYNETIIRRIRNDDWNGTPLCFDALLAAATEAGIGEKQVMKAIAAPMTLDDCPRCGTPADYDNGACCCPDCGWHEASDTITTPTSEPARAGVQLHEGDAPALIYRSLPLASDLPDDVLVLDATATPGRIDALFHSEGKEDVTVEGDAEFEANLHTTQIVDGQYHYRTIKRSARLRDRIQTAIDTAGDLHDKPLYILRRGLIPEFDFPKNSEVMHYHGVRGLDRNDCDAVICIGAPHPDIGDLQREAELLTQHREDVRVGGEEYSTRRDEATGELAAQPPVYRKISYTDDDGKGRAVPTKAYSGLVGELFREGREKELVQAVHRIRPLLADETNHAYLLTNVPTSLAVDNVASIDELTAPLAAFLPVPEGAIRLLEHVHDLEAGDAPDGFRSDQLVEADGEGSLVFKKRELTRLVRLNGEDVTHKTVNTWVNKLQDVGLLQPGDYEHRAGVPYTADTATLKRALSVLSSNTGFKVAAVRRFRALTAKADGSLEWLRWARDVLGMTGEVEDLDPPPSPAG